MTYVQGRIIHDADGHVVEPPNWLFNYADKKMRDRIGMISDGPHGPLGPNDIDKIRARRPGPEMRASGEFGIMTDKMLDALGAFDAADRPEALDRLGFASQLMFPSFVLLPLHRADIDGDDTDFAYRAAEICNRAMVDFCSVDSRMLCVSYLSLRDFERAKKTAEQLLASGTNAIMISCNSPHTHSPSHINLDPVWARIEEAGIPVVLHVGAGDRLVDPGIAINGQGDEEIRYSSEQHFTAVSIVVVARAVMQTLSALIIDGVMDRFPRLKFGIIEHGAAWVPSWIRQLDTAHDAYFKLESRLHKLSLRPSEYVSRQIRVTPYSVDDVGWIIEQAGEDICMFSSDYPHFEGGRDPVARFDKSIARLSESAKQNFYCNNFVDLMAMA
jgi:predicted TIM-barrel fold metal-dependent hydrolase